ncbi:MAG: MlaD family protein [candidate division Zixibacteria bacterium]
MTSKNVELKVGLLVIVGAAIVVFAIWLARGYRYGQDYYPVSVVFPEVGALATGDPVAVSGVTKGKIKKISLYEGQVLTVLDMATDVQLKEDATFIVKNIGLMGERFISAKTGVSDRPLDLSRPAAGIFDPGIPEVMSMMGTVISNMNRLVNSLEQTVISPQTLDKFSLTIANLQSLTARLESAAENELPKIDTALDNFVSLSETLKAGVDRNQPHIDSAAQNMNEAGKRFLTLLDDMEEASKRLKSFATDLDNSDGTLRMLMEDRRLYDDLRATSKKLDSLVSDIRANPKKYVNFSLEIF